MVDAARGIFFALSQMYEALRQFTVSVTHEGLSGVLMKVLHPARKFLSQLIDALDRFDEQAKQPVPSPIVCRSVVQSCKDSVSIFGKVVGVLNMQLNLVTATHDPRYTRWLLLILHGSMTEVSLSWHTIQEHSEAIQPYLQTSRLKAHAPSRSLVSPVTPDVGQSSASPSSNGSASNAMGWTRTARRQGGSFGTKEIQIARTTSSDALPGTLSLRRSGGSNGGPSFGNGLSAPSLSNGALHARDDSTSSQISRFETEMNNGFVTSQSSSLVPARAQPPQPLAASAMDQNLFATMDDTIEVASGVWSTLSEIVAEHGLPALAATLEDSQEVTRRLRSDLDSFRIGSTAVLRKAIWEDANAFLKVCFARILLFNLLITSPDGRSSTVRDQRPVHRPTTGLAPARQKINRIVGSAHARVCCAAPDLIIRTFANSPGRLTTKCTHSQYPTFDGRTSYGGRRAVTRAAFTIATVRRIQDSAVAISEG